MPKQTGNVGGLLGKLGNRLREAHDSHKNDETEFQSFSNLPAGIDEGVAQLEDCEFQIIKDGKKHAGDYQFYASGTVIEPEEHTYEDPPNSKRMKTMKTRGLRTFIVEPLYDEDDPKSKRTRKTIDDHLKWIYNELRKLGYDTSNMEIEDLEAAAEALREAKPIFKFRTWKGQPTTDFPNPLVNHSWEGLVDESYTLPDDSDQDIDKTTSAPKASANGVASSKTPKAPARSTTRAPAKDQSPPEDLEFGDIASLVAAANEDKQSAKDTLEKMAIQVGKSAEDVNDAVSWEEVGEWISEGGSNDEGARETEETNENENEEKEDENEEEEDPEPVKPSKGEVWKARLTDPKTKVKSKKLSQVEVSTVYLKTSTCDVKELGTKKVFKGVKFADMTPMED